VQDVARMLNALIGIFTICGGFIVTTTTPQLRNVEHSIVQSAVGTMLKLASLIWGKQYLMNSPNYYKSRLLLTLKSWLFWINIPSNEIDKYYNRELYFSVVKDGITVAANFWCMINDGSMDMEDT